MKQGWEIKKLGEVCDKLTDGSHNPPQGVLHSEYEMLSSQNVFNDKINHNAVRFLSYDDFIKEDKRTSVRDGDVLLTIVGTIGRCAVFTGSKNITLQRSVAVVRPKENILSRFLMYCLIGKSALLNEGAHGIAQKGLYLRQLGNILVPVPPREEQERIVAELDCLSGVIERKREQLQQLDALAQSIFYQMFGDPITNEKGWETCELQKVSTLLNGRAYKQNELLDEGKYKVLRVGNFFTNSNYYYSDLELEPEKYCDNGDLLFAWSASFGAFIWNGGKVIYHYHIWKVLYDKQKLNIDYYRFLLNTMTAYFMKDVHGIGMVHLTKAGMEQYILPIPPLTLQQEFADKIEAIEIQKQLIKDSIAETEELFNSRMSYYFN